MAQSTREGLLDVAERLFAASGYAGTSFRAVTSEAGANQAAIHYHFGSKQQLFEEVVRRRVLPLARERSQRLDELEAGASDGPLAIETVIEAFIRPVLDVLLSGPQARSWMKLIGWYRVEPGDHWRCMDDELADTHGRFRQAFAQALAPLGLSEEERDYRLFFFLGIEVNTLSDVGGLRAINPALPTVYEAPDEVLARLVRFVAAGMAAPATAPLPSPSKGVAG
jgi:AcrR family transcriptional regulator